MAVSKTLAVHVDDPVLSKVRQSPGLCDCEFYCKNVSLSSQS